MSSGMLWNRMEFGFSKSDSVFVFRRKLHTRAQAVRCAHLDGADGRGFDNALGPEGEVGDEDTLVPVVRGDAGLRRHSRTGGELPVLQVDV